MALVEGSMVIDAEFSDVGAITLGYMQGIEDTIKALEEHVVDGPVPIDEFIFAIRSKLERDKRRHPRELANELIARYSERQ